MSEYVLYVLVGLIVLLIAFLLLRLILQLVFIRQCPDCGRTVSLIKTKECPRCGHDFRSQSDPKFRLTMVLFVAAILGIGAFDVYSFQAKTKAYQADNPYMSVSHITREALDEAETEEMQTEEVQTEEAGAIEMPLPEAAPVE